ncbi:hypothetical protein EHS13_16835 [Paenibacillus psychroresistens]|uniref:DUF4878 domain-containing protein n=1 Tax=Paenibacillus psychroresistens TaxID=1778678 RepID=A0A6B8RIZ5_9BACL|nr:hypothetical protein [Paenibacillus psychroresistens]QGQ96431.1 hypothetical protein EHS13_16835 [Paenibacillus psychroresistens]
MKKYIAIFFVIILLLWGFLLKMSRDENEFTPLVNRFYSDFINKDYQTMYTYFDNIKSIPDYEKLPSETKMGIIAQSLLNDRHWYGSIQEYKQLESRWRGFGVRKVTIKLLVNAENNKVKQYEDNLILVKKNGNWKIKEYRSGSPWQTKVMP